MKYKDAVVIGKDLYAGLSMPATMYDVQKSADIETLARMAARLAGRDPEVHVEIRLGQVVSFSDVAWRYPDFMARAEAAYAMLESAGF